MNPKRTRTKRQDVSDVEAHTNFEDILYRRVVKNGNAYTLAIGPWIKDWRNVRICLVSKSADEVTVTIQSIDKEIQQHAQSARIQAGSGQDA